MTVPAISDMLRDAARRAMPKHQARRFEQVLSQLEGKRPVYRLAGYPMLATPHLPPITVDARFRPSRAKARKVPAPTRQLRLL